MAFDGTEGGLISMETASSMTRAYREANPGQRIAHFFGMDILNEILAQEGCLGIRMYYALNEDGDKELVIVGADADENDLLEKVADLSLPCPNRCSSSNKLNS
jgi:hypothetical protein